MASNGKLSNSTIAKLETTLRTAPQNKNQHKTLTIQWEQQLIMNHQQQNHRLRTDSSRSHRGVGGGGGWINFTDQIFRR